MVMLHKFWDFFLCIFFRTNHLTNLLAGGIMKIPARRTVRRRAQIKKSLSALIFIKVPDVPYVQGLSSSTGVLSLNFQTLALMTHLTSFDDFIITELNCFVKGNFYFLKIPPRVEQTMTNTRTRGQEKATVHPPMV